MLRFKQLFLQVTVILALGATVLLACGPFFGIEVLGNRKQVLLAPPTISFESQLKALVPPPKDKLPVVESDNSFGEAVTRESIETKALDSAVFARIQTMRQQNSGEAARALGETLPAAIQLYTTGAVSFLHGQTAAARTDFQNILSLPAEERKSRELWARFMLGRIAITEGNQTEAASQFEASRMLVRQGTSDPLGLAVASFGEQARGAWKTGAVANAVELYAQQASYGSQSGANSLVTLAGLILKDNDLLDRAVQAPIARRLLFICANGNNGRPFFIETETPGNPGSKVDRIVAALERHQLTQVAGAGLLASAAYNQGRFDLAQKLSALEDTPMSAWVTAKLALRKGDREAALKSYDKALKLPFADVSLIQAEAGILRVSRSDYVQALDLFYRAAASGHNSESKDTISSDWFGFADYWGDVAYLAERVLTTNELQNYIDGRLHSTSTLSENVERSRIRSILARRYMRAGQYRDAFRYFDDSKMHDAARQYSDAVSSANSWWRLKLTRAEAWFTAAKLARNNGMELLGFEKEPDFAMWGGDFAPWDGDSTPYGAKIIAAEQQRKREQITPYQTEDERKRVAASKPEHDVRFQYRLTAVEQAMKSAALLPASSQAYAAVLCEATKWVVDRQPKQAAQIYQQYLHNGAYVPWGRTFGRTCPAPDFASVSFWNTALRREKRLAKKVRVHPFYAVLFALVALAVPATLIYYGRNIRKRTHLA